MTNLNLLQGQGYKVEELKPKEQSILSENQKVLLNRLIAGQITGKDLDEKVMEQVLYISETALDQDRIDYVQYIKFKSLVR